MNEPGLVLLDTSVLESRYLRPLLHGETCWDLKAIRQRGHQIGVLRKSLAEVWMHAKVGGGNTRQWATAEVGYPGSIDRVISRLEQMDATLDGRRTAWLWFNLSQEWYDAPSEIGVPHREFLDWKRAMESFCERVEAALRANGIRLLSAWAEATAASIAWPPWLLERELALHSLLPNEDAAWLLDAILVQASAVITCDDGVLEQGRYSLGFNLCAPSTVHPSRICDALDDDFGLASYPAHPIRRERATRIRPRRANDR